MSEIFNEIKESITMQEVAELGYIELLQQRAKIKAKMFQFMKSKKKGRRK